MKIYFTWYLIPVVLATLPVFWLVLRRDAWRLVFALVVSLGVLAVLHPIFAAIALGLIAVAWQIVELHKARRLSGGRAVLGIGRGLGRIEFDGFGVDMNESRERFVEYAEALALASDTRRFEGEAEALLADALGKHPDHQRALWLSGIAAVQREDRAAALAHWQRLLPLLPPDSSVYTAVAEQIRGLGGNVPELAAAPVTPPSAPAAAIADGGPALRVTVRIADALTSRVAPTDTVYVFARAAEGPKMPLAIQRFAASELPKEVVLDDTMGMMPTLKLSQVPRIVLGARISKSGNAIPQSGDFEVIGAPFEQGDDAPPHELVIADVVP